MTSESTYPGAPSGALLLLALTETSEWLGTTPEELGDHLGIGSGDVAAWTQQPKRFPDHPRIPALVLLWAAVAGALEEFGAGRTKDLVRETRFGQEGGAGAGELSEVLLSAADEASQRALEETEYDSRNAVPMALEELEGGERALSAALSRELGS